VPLLGCKAFGCGAGPFDGVPDVQVPQPDDAVVVDAGEYVPVGPVGHRIDSVAAAGQGQARDEVLCGPYAVSGEGERRREPRIAGTGLEGFSDHLVVDRLVSLLDCGGPLEEGDA
jgi:hypothetical protein